MKELTLNVPQGIGDAFWVYQKFAPHVDRLHLNVMKIGESREEIQSRSIPFLKLLPKVGNVKQIGVSSEKYQHVSKNYWPMDKVFARAEARHESVYYSCNYPLECGTRLEAIDPAFAVQAVVPLPHAPREVYHERSYLALYVSGDAKLSHIVASGLWPVPPWAELVKALYARFDLNLPIKILGAEYDRKSAEPLAELLRRDGRDVETVIGARPELVVNLLRYAEFFVGHQSGLNVLADQVGTPQLMVYLDVLRPMAYTWCKPGHEGKVFTAAFFSEKPADIVNRIAFRVGKRV